MKADAEATQAATSANLRSIVSLKEEAAQVSTVKKTKFLFLSKGGGLAVVKPTGVPIASRAPAAEP